MCSCRLLLHGCAVRPIGAAMSRRGSCRRRVCNSCSNIAALLMRRRPISDSLPLTAFGRMRSQSASCSRLRSDLVFLCAPRRRVRRGALSLRLCARRAVSRSVPPVASSPAFRSRCGAGVVPAWFYVGRLRLIGCGCVVCVLTACGRAGRFVGRLCSPAASSGPTAGRRRRAVRRSSLLAGVVQRADGGPSSG